MTSQALSPHDAAAERALLGALLLEPSQTLKDIGELEPHDFYNSSHQRIYSAARLLQQNGKPVDVVMIHAELQDDLLYKQIGGAAYIAKLMDDVPSAASATAYAETVRDAASARRVAHSATALAQRAQDRANWPSIHQDAQTELRLLNEGERTQDNDLNMPSIVDLFSKDIAPRNWIVDNMLQEQKTLLLFGTSYTGKSLLSYEAAIKIADGQGQVLGNDVTGGPRNVMLFMGENDELELRETIKVQMEGPAIPTPENFRYCDVLAIKKHHPLATPHGMAWYREVILQNQSQVVIIDNLMSLAGADLSKSETATEVMGGLKRISKELGTTFIVIAHTRKASTKGDDADEASKLYGAQEWLAFADAAIHLGFEKDRYSGRRIVHQPKLRGGQAQDPFIARIDPETLHFHFEATMGPQTHKAGRPSKITPLDALENLRQQGEPMTVDDLKEALDCGRTSVYKIIRSDTWKEWIEDGSITVTEQSRKGSPSTFQARTSTN